MIDEPVAGRPLDLLIADKVMGCRMALYDGLEADTQMGWRCCCDHATHITVTPDPESFYGAFYSSELADAWKIVEQLHGLGWTTMVNGSPATKDGPWYASFAKGPTTHRASADTVALAICRAAMKLSEAK